MKYNKITRQEFVDIYNQVYLDGGTGLDVRRLTGLTSNQIKCRKSFYKKEFNIQLPKLRFGRLATI